MPRKLKPGYSKAGREYVREKTSYLIEEEGMEPSQAYAVAHKYARDLGYKVPVYRTVKGRRRRFR
jgi:hypothetical protein